ncbi:MAG: diaminopropionate ammonia-lyase [Ruminococcaceae bacterium]|nr:diaminopropionate ammonia-lyase [Oscillospiraceae bacterium]
MNEKFRIASLLHTDVKQTALHDYDVNTAQKVRDYHRSFPMYKQTPLCCMQNTAADLGLGNIYVKNEAERFGLNAFKVLGGSFAVGSILAERAGKNIFDTDYTQLISAEIKNKNKDLTFITATDGNHGRGVAWSATQFGCKSIVYMPKGSVAQRLENISKAGADASITDLNYDDTVRLATKHANENGFYLVQDTAFGDYVEIPKRIMQGYCTMALEAHEQLPEKPTHIFLQAGVGSMAAAVTAFFASVYGENRPVITIVEPLTADCFYRTAKANDGKLHSVEGDMKTIMAGLACGEPCSLAWDILSQYADHFISFHDEAAADGMRLLARPFGNDMPIVAGESGAAAFGCVAEIMRNPELSELRKILQLNENSVVLFFNTEGATDTENYYRIINAR